MSASLYRMADPPSDEFGIIASLDMRVRASEASAELVRLWANLALECGEAVMAESLVRRAVRQRQLTEEVRSLRG